MRFSSTLCALLLLSCAPLLAESKNPADYPLRVHIYPHQKIHFYYGKTEEDAKGEGIANIFENGVPHGIEFTFDCSQNIKGNAGFETYPAKWKKPNQELVVLVPVFAKSNAFFTCNLKTSVKDEVFVTNNGRMMKEPTAEFKDWMAKHDYDPEHGKDSPTKLDPPKAPAAQ